MCGFNVIPGVCGQRGASKGHEDPVLAGLMCKKRGEDTSSVGIIIPLLQQLLKHHLLFTWGLIYPYQNWSNHAVS